MMLSLYAEQGAPPTLNELADIMDVSRTAVWDMMQRLVRKGLVTQAGRGSRRYIPVADTCPVCRRPMPDGGGE